MKSTVALLALSGCLTSGFALPIFDPFADASASGGSSYAAGEPLPWQTNAFGDAWFGLQTSSTDTNTWVVITNSNLSYPGLPASSGNAVLLKNSSGLRGRMFISDTPDGFLPTNVTATIYYSLLVQLQDITALSTDGIYFIGFNNQTTLGDQSSAGNIQGAGLYFRKAGSQYQVGIGKNPPAVAPIVYDETLRDLNETLFIVAAYEIIYDEENPQPEDDNVRLWINPSAASFGASTPPLETLGILAQGADINTVLSSFQLMNRSTVAPDITVVDDVRIGRTWTFVTGGPEFKTPLPAEVVVGQGVDLTLTVEARSGGPSALTYRWQTNGVDLADGGRISGSTTASLTVSGVVSSDAATYSVTVSNGMGVASTESILSVSDTLIATHPQDRTNTVGTAATFSVTVSGPPAASYAWYHNNNLLSDGGNISGSATATLTISPVSNADAGSYHVVVETGSAILIPSDAATLTVEATSGLPLHWDSNGEVAGGGAGTGTWGSDPFWSADASGSAPTGVWLNNARAIFSAGDDVVGAYTVTVVGAQVLTGITVEEGSPTVTGGSGNLVFANPSGEAELHVTSGAFGTIGTVVSGSNDLIKTGEGPLRFNNANNAYTGRTIIREGNFLLAQENRLGSLPAAFVPDSVILDGGTMEWVNTGGQTVDANRGFTITTNGGTLHKSASANVTINGVIAGTGPLRRTGINQFTLAGNNTFAGPFIMQADTPGNLTTFTGSNNLSEGMQLEVGELRLNAQGASGTGIISIAPDVTVRTTLGVLNEVVLVPNDIVTTGPGRAVLTTGGGSQAHIHFSGVISGSGGIHRPNTGDKQIIVSGDNTFSGGLEIVNGQVIAGHRNAFGNGTITIGRQGPDEFPVGGSFHFIQFNGWTNDMTGANAIPNPIIAYQQFSMAISIQTNDLEFSGPIDLAAADFDIRVFANYAPLVHRLSGVIGSSTGRGLGKHGVGTLILSAANTYPGGTVVVSGALRVNNSSGSGTGTGPVVVEAGPGFDPPTLGGNGTIAGTVTVLSGIISPGAAAQAAGKLTLQNGLDMGGANTVLWELATLNDDGSGAAGIDFDQVAVTGGGVNVGGATLVLGFLDGTEPDAAAAFWQAERTWTIVALSGTGQNPGDVNFLSIQNPGYAAGEFTTEVAANGSILLRFTPAAAPFTIEGISGDPNSAMIRWQSQIGVDYEVQYKTNINQTGWLVLTNVPGSGGLISVVDNHGGDPERYYRLATAP